MYANDRKVISAMTAIDKLRGFDAETVSATLSAAEIGSNRRGWTEGLFLLRSGLIFPSAEGDKLETAKGDSYSKIAARLNDENGVSVWSKGAMSKNCQSVIHALGGYEEVMVAEDPWGLVTQLEAAHGAASSYYTANVAPKKDEGEKAPRGQKSARELLLTAIRQAEAEGMTAEEVCAFVTENMAG